MAPVATGEPAPTLAGAWTYVPKADIDAVVKEIEKPGAYGDQAVRTIDLPTINYRVGVYVLHSTSLPREPQNPATSIVSLKALQIKRTRDRTFSTDAQPERH